MSKETKKPKVEPKTTREAREMMVDILEAYEETGGLNVECSFDEAKHVAVYLTSHGWVKAS